MTLSKIIIVFYTTLCLGLMSPLHAMRANKKIKNLAALINCDSVMGFYNSLDSLLKQNNNEALILSAINYALQEHDELIIKDKYNCTPLHMACISGDEAITHSILLAAQQNSAQNLEDWLFYKRNNGSTALHWACVFDKAQCVIEILNSASSINDGNKLLKSLITKQNNYGYTALHIACENCCEHCVLALIEKACTLKDNFETLRLMLSVRSKKGNTALKLAYLVKDKKIAYKDPGLCIEILQEACKKVQ
jgi:ankyrin repeat protein